MGAKHAAAPLPKAKYGGGDRNGGDVAEDPEAILDLGLSLIRREFEAIESNPGARVDGYRAMAIANYVRALSGVAKARSPTATGRERKASMEGADHRGDEGTGVVGGVAEAGGRRMTRAAALAHLAAGCMRQGSLLQYQPGELLVVDHLLSNADRIASREAPEHVFDAAPFKPAFGGFGGLYRAYGYAVDPDA